MSSSGEEMTGGGRGIMKLRRGEGSWFVCVESQGGRTDGVVRTARDMDG